MGKTFYLIFVSVTVFLMSSTSIDSESREYLPESYLHADMKLGGQLYDNWPKIKNIDISTKHPLYPAKNRWTGIITWRCKECHGWDYLGAEGSYGHDPHYTGIKGIYNTRNKTPEELYAALTDREANHDFTEKLYLSVSEIWALVKFIREGLIDAREVMSIIGVANGDTGEGEHLYGQYCAECHGMDGNKIDFREDLEGVHGVGWEAVADPQETLHKIRWGHPGTDKPSMIMDNHMSDKDTVDILSFCQTLYY